MTQEEFEKFARLVCLVYFPGRARGARDDRGAAFASMMLSYSERYRGDWTAAADIGRRGEAFARRAGRDDLVSGSLLAQGYALRDMDPERALPLFDEGARVGRVASAQYVALCVYNAGLIRIRLGDHLGARRGFDEALDVCERTVGYDYAALTAGHLALGLLDVGDTDDARAAVMLLASAEQFTSPIALYGGLGIGPDDLMARFGTVLDAETIAELRARGAALDFDETVALARAALARVTCIDDDPEPSAST